MKIFFVNGIRAGETLVFSVPLITVGREDSNVLELSAEGISRFHGRLFCEDDVWFAEDLGSTNGVKVNNRLIQEPTKLCEGDLVEFGDQMIRVTELGDAMPQIIFNPLGSDVSAEADSRATRKVVVANSAPSEMKHATKTIDISAALKDGKLKIFGGGASKSRDDDHDDSQNATPGRRRIMSNRMFYTIVICAVVVAIAGFYRFASEQGAQKRTASAPKENVKDFLLFYEKEISSPDNVFRFVLEIENGKALFTIDDLKSARRFQRTLENLNAISLEPLRSRVARSGILAATSPQQGSAEFDTRERRRMVVGTGRALNDVSVVNNNAPRAFEEMESAIALFADHYGLQTISMTPQELKDQAESNFVKAEELFGNRAAGLKNLRDAILRYKIAVDYLEQFSPKPALWDKARKQLELAERLRAQKYKELDFEQARLIKFREFDALRFIYAQQMELCDPDSREYNLARERLFILDRHLNQAKRR